MKKYLLVLFSILFFFFSFNKACAQQAVLNGASTSPINFPTGSCVYTWTNNNTSIGLAASGTGNIASFAAVNTGNSPVIATITGTPVGTGFAYIVNAGSNNVSVVDIATSAVVATIAVNQKPNSVAVDPNYNEVYIVNNGSATISVISTLTNAVIKTISVGTTPWSVTVGPDGSKIYVADGDDNEIDVIDATTNTIIDRIPAGTNPNALAVSPDGSLIYVNNHSSILVINTSTHNVVATIPVGQLPQGILITPDGSMVYEANYSSNNVDVISTATNTVVATIQVGSNPGGGSMSPDGSLVYIANELSNDISVISTVTNTVIKTIPVGIHPWGISVRPDGSQIYVGNAGSNTVSVVDVATYAILTNIPVGSEPYSFGNFFTAGMNCTALVKYTITVNPTPSLGPTITAGTATGAISACVGTASVSPNVQQFTVSGNGLTANVTATAPAGFEVSLAAGSGYGSSVTIPQTSGAVNSTVVYVRSAAGALAGSISGNITLTSAGAGNQTVAVTGTVNALPTVNAVANQTVLSGTATTAVNFAGTGNTFNWVNDRPGIGLAASGGGNIASFTAVNNGNSPVVAKITVTPRNSGIAYIPNSGSNDVTVINTATNAPVTTIPVGAAPIGVASSPDGSRVYITCNGTISVINTATNTVISTINIGTYAWGILISPDGSKLYVAYPRLNSVAVIDAATGAVLSTIVLANGTGALAISPDGGTLYVGNSTSNTISVVNTASNTIIATIAVGLAPNCAAVSPDGSRLYITNADSGNISVINTATNTVIATVAVGSYPYGVVVSPDGSRVYVANNTAASVSVIDAATNTVISIVRVGSEPTGISINWDGSIVYVVNGGGNSISVINTATNTTTTTVSTGQAPYSVGNFITPGTCSGLPTTFTITVNPTIPTITASAATGTITACAGTASASPNIQQFTVLGSGLIGNITAAAPPGGGFEISLAAGSGYGSSVNIPQTSGAVNSTVVYVRSAAGAPAGSISGNITLTSAGAGNQTVAVTGTVNALPTINAVANQTVNDGAAAAAVNFTGTGGTFTWVNDAPGIGLAASGSGNIGSFTAINNGNSPVVAKITVTPASPGYAYVPNAISKDVSVINTATHTVEATIPVGTEPYYVAVTPDGSEVYIANLFAGTVSVINTTTNTVIATIPVGDRPTGITVSPDGKNVYVAIASFGWLAVISTGSHSVTGSILLDGGQLNAMSISQDGKWLYVTDPASNEVIIVNTATNAVLNNITVGGMSGVFDIATSPTGDRVYVTGGSNNNLLVINSLTNTLIATIPLGYAAIGCAVSPDGSRVYVTNESNNLVSVINTGNNTVVATIPVGTSPEGIAVTPDGSSVYVANVESNSVSIISIATNKVTNTVNVGQYPHSVGNFITAGTNCTGVPTSFTITVNPGPPTIIATTVATGTITACTGVASASPNIQQFTVSGSGLSADITATAPVNFEVSLAAGSGYGGSITIPQTSGAVNNTVVYVRSTANASTGGISGNVTLTSPGAPSQTVAVSGTVNPVSTSSLIISASANNICAGTPVTFTAIPTNGGSSPVYQWTVNGSNAGTNSATFSSSTLANGDVVSCVMTSSNACVIPPNATGNRITMNVTAVPIPSITVAASQNSVCAGIPVTFTATPVNGGATPAYQWLVNGNNVGSNSSTFSANNLANGDVVTCLMTSNEACATPTNTTSNSITMDIGTNLTPEVSIALSQNNICPGTNVTFTATPTNGGNTPVYQWMLNGNSAGINSPTFASSTLANGDVISCRVTSNATCLTIPDATSNSVTMIVNTQAAPAVSINISANNVCAGTPVIFTATPTNGGSSPVYQWLLNGSNIGTNSATFSNTPANGDVVSCVMTSSLACATPSNTTSNSIIANIFPLPVVKAGGNKTIKKGNSVALTATMSGDIADITWSPPTGLDNNKILNPRTSPELTTLYTITVQTAEGCMATDSVTVNVFDGITIPNTFTPNGDGVNDTWNIQNLKDYPNCVVRIFDRWGAEVFSSTGYYNAWDGTLKGSRLPAGTYYYVINLNDGTRPSSGFVALIR